MLQFQGNSPYERNGKVAKNLRVEKIKYDESSEKDMELMSVIRDMILNLQPRCPQCKHYKEMGCFGGYSSSECEILGNLEAADNPMYDMDATKCSDFKKNVQFDKDFVESKMIYIKLAKDVLDELVDARPDDKDFASIYSDLRSTYITMKEATSYLGCVIERLEEYLDILNYIK